MGSVHLQKISAGPQRNCVVILVDSRARSVGGRKLIAKGHSTLCDIKALFPTFDGGPLRYPATSVSDTAREGGQGSAVCFIIIIRRQ